VKQRVHELARELGVPVDDVHAALRDLGEYVKSSSSTLELPVARAVRSALAASAGGGGRPGADHAAPQDQAAVDSVSREASRRSGAEHGAV
jgi:translation initiation factor IF-2